MVAQSENRLLLFVVGCIPSLRGEVTNLMGITISRRERQLVARVGNVPLVRIEAPLGGKFQLVVPCDASSRARRHLVPVEVGVPSTRRDGSSLYQLKGVRVQARVLPKVFVPLVTAVDWIFREFPRWEQKLLEHKCDPLRTLLRAFARMRIDELKRRAAEIPSSTLEGEVLKILNAQREDLLEYLQLNGLELSPPDRDTIFHLLVNAAAAPQRELFNHITNLEEKQLDAKRQALRAKLFGGGERVAGESEEKLANTEEDALPAHEREDFSNADAKILKNLPEVEKITPASSPKSQVSSEKATAPDFAAKVPMENTVTQISLPVEVPHHKKNPEPGLASEDQGKKRIDRLRKLVRGAKKLKREEIGKYLNLSGEDLFDQLLDWANEFGFKIDDEYVVFEGGRTDDFIAQLDEDFAEWGKPKGGKK